MKIQGLDKEVRNVLGADFLRIPRYQRPYRWEIEHVSDFWNDALAGDTNDYFIGSMVVFPDKSKDTFEVVDGQQRLTTITMVLASIRDALKAEGLDDLANGTQQLIERKDLSNKSRFVLETETSYPYFHDHIQRFGPPESDEPKNAEEQQLARSYVFIRQQVGDVVELARSMAKGTKAAKRKAVASALEVLRERVLSLKLIHVTVDSEDDAYVIFETLNARGEDLQLADLVKAHLTKSIRPTSPKYDFARDEWGKLRARLEGAQRPIEIDTFIHHWWLSRHEYVALRKLYPKFRKAVNKSNAREIVKALIADVATYRQISEPKSHTWASEEASIRGALEALTIFRVTQPLPMLLATMRAYRDKTLALKSVRDVLLAIERFHFLGSAVVGRSSSGGISGMYASSARQVFGATSSQQRANALAELRKKLRARKPTRDEFVAAFKTIRFTDDNQSQRRLVKYILSRLDGAHDSGAAIDYDRMTIEHVASQNPGAGSPSVSADAYGQIGNLLLVTEATNQALENKPFSAKLLILQKAKSWVDPTILGAQQWGEKEIAARTKALADLAYDKVWFL
jgi:hypothetical protein